VLNDEKPSSRAVATGAFVKVEDESLARKNAHLNLNRMSI